LSSIASGWVTTDSSGSFSGNVFNVSDDAGGNYCVNEGSLTGAFNGTAVTFSATTSVQAGSTGTGCAGGATNGTGTADAAYPNAASASGTFTAGTNTGNFTMTQIPVSSGYETFSIAGIGGCGGCIASTATGSIIVDPTGNFSGSNYSISSSSNGTGGVQYCVNVGTMTGTISGTSVTFSGSAVAGAGSTDTQCTGGTFSGTGTADAAYPNTTYVHGTGADNQGHQFTFFLVRGV
jgi:hypothetical protein